MNGSEIGGFVSALMDATAAVFFVYAGDYFCGGDSVGSRLRSPEWSRPGLPSIRERFSEDDCKHSIWDILAKSRNFG
jgi:hypothetical protein